LVREKGIDVLLKAVKILVDEGFLVKCVIVGSGPELNPLARLSEELKITSYVTFTGLITDEHLRKLISSASCGVIPSRREGTPVALLEYMALGKPVVATNVGGIGEILQNRELIVPPNDPAALAIGIRTVLKNEDFAIRVGMENREKAKQYTWSKIAGEISVIFETILSYECMHA
jgi:glycosyltransferase involved in cell wall biosynthesis